LTGLGRDNGGGVVAVVLGGLGEQSSMSGAGLDVLLPRVFWRSIVCPVVRMLGTLARLLGVAGLGGAAALFGSWLTEPDLAKGLGLVAIACVGAIVGLHVLRLRRAVRLGGPPPRLSRRLFASGRALRPPAQAGGTREPAAAEPARLEPYAAAAARLEPYAAAADVESRAPGPEPDLVNSRPRPAAPASQPMEDPTPEPEPEPLYDPNTSEKAEVAPQPEAAESPQSPPRGTVKSSCAAR